MSKMTDVTIVSNQAYGYQRKNHGLLPGQAAALHLVTRAQLKLAGSLRVCQVWGWRVRLDSRGSKWKKLVR
jgi:hypothetical protein